MIPSRDGVPEERSLGLKNSRMTVNYPHLNQASDGHILAYRGTTVTVPATPTVSSLSPPREFTATLISTLNRK